jgi:deoxycytidylate deaminase
MIDDDYLVSWFYPGVMTQAYLVATNSPDPQSQNGAILLDESLFVQGIGWNDFPKGVNEKYWTSSQEDKYYRVVHAETAALLNAARSGKATEGGVLVCPWSACAACAKHIAYLGIETLVRHTSPDRTEYSSTFWHNEGLIGDSILEEAGVRIVEIKPVQTYITLRRHGKTWNDRNEI